ncbi:protein FAR1-RELATED SEQUENCE 11-like [Diospyros lotus]|uniref:protein FAR1-RELATED SEQUENCE 11-like n=1 Tax=Diospyros lotus TaxID=55363 RepID=UPI00224E48DC|nr:protein FAR1-RELATED SEQUENCE 11-like [Diospyros lotus]
MPATKHALCIWMIVAKSPSWFNTVLGESYNEWKAEFYQLYNLESIEDFELGWRDMVNSFGLHTNRHITNLFALRSLWALPYLRSHFLAGMTATGQSKQINAFIQRFLSAQSRLHTSLCLLVVFPLELATVADKLMILCCVAYYPCDTPVPLFIAMISPMDVAVAVDFKDRAGEQQMTQQNLQNICLKTGAPMESDAAPILTPFAFSKLQEQLVLAALYASFQMEDGFLEGIISCSCHQFEFSGILCRHALRVLSTGNCFQIPERYFPLRWLRISIPSPKLLQSSTNDQAERIQLLQHMVSTLVTESTKSKERLDIPVEQVSIPLSRIREQPVLSKGMRDISSMNRNNLEQLHASEFS